MADFKAWITSTDQNFFAFGIRQPSQQETVFEMVCFENKPGLQCVRFFPCGHSFCKDCVKAFFREKLTSQQVSPLTCLADHCESSASQKVIIELLGQKEFDRYERILLRKVLERMDDMVTCPRISCQKPSAVSETGNLDVISYFARCAIPVSALIVMRFLERRTMSITSWTPRNVEDQGYKFHWETDLYR